MIHEKKLWPQWFQKIMDGDKTFELRLADWECKEGDVLFLREWDPETKEYTGREMKKKVGWVGKFKIDELVWPREEIEKHGLQIISLKD